MKSPKKFLKELKIKKALDGFDYKFSCGEKLSMFNNTYKVIAPSDQFVILEDENLNKIALPTNQLKLMIKKGSVIGKNVLTKASNPPSMMGHRSGVSPSAAKDSSSVAPGSGVKKPRGVPVGTEKQSADGQWYRKVSDNPSKWVHTTHGTTHQGEEPGGDQEHHLSDPEDAKSYHNVVSKLMGRASKDDVAKIEGMLIDYIKVKKQIAGHAQLAKNPAVDEKGNKLPVHKFEADRPHEKINALHDKKIKLFKDLQSAIHDATSKKPR